MKVSELECTLLDLWVAHARGNEKAAVQSVFNFQPACYWVRGHWTGGEYSPSTNWAQGGPIIAKMIESGEFCVWEYGGVVTVSNHDPEGLPCKEPRREDVPRAEGQASTLLVAAMRSYVASVFGEEVPAEGSYPPSSATA